MSLTASPFQETFADPFTSPFERIFALSEGPDTHLSFDNWETEFQRAATENSIDTNSSDYNDFVEWILFNASAFNLADGAAMEAALNAESLTIADLDTYAAAYTP